MKLTVYEFNRGIVLETKVVVPKSEHHESIKVLSSSRDFVRGKSVKSG